MDILLSSAKETETAMTVTEAIEVSAPFYYRKEVRPRRYRQQVLTFQHLSHKLTLSYLACIHLLENHFTVAKENLSVFSTKTSDITTPSTGVIEVLVPSTTEMEISAPSTESNDISVSFTASNEVSASVEPYRQHLSVEESTVPSSVETFSVSSAVKSEMTTPYSGAIEISSPLSIVERDTSSSFTGQTDFLSSVTQAVKVSASAEFYSLYPSAEESISQSLKESFTVSSAKASDIATPPVKPSSLIAFFY
ncbi:hypothetical protein C0Q70_03577 [Pomacea canaliculata]|uniref:Uncharacterized protein n=1 Tax=Pomacea canaliculata TaxID=400727 RepID=A0A2T7PT38_POMCA|nr:hypothetical protein C0Q70_03577 [Pomacea canaliculata]